MRVLKKRKHKECECGCGEWVNPGKRFIRGHYNKGRKLSEETRRKLSLANKGQKCSEEIKRKMSIAKKGRKHSDEHIRKIVLGNKGKKRSEETKLQMSISNMRCRTDGYCDAWSDKEFKQDCKKDECEICGVALKYFKDSKEQRRPNLLLHHKDLNPMNCHPDNLQTLCISCHQKLHQEKRYRKKL